MKTAAASAQSAADAAMTAAKAAQTAADNAQTAADKAQKAAEAAAETGKAAAATAKAEAINEAIAKVNEILKGYATKDELNTVASKIDAIDADLLKNGFGNVDALAKAVAEMQIQLKALEKYQEYGTQIGLMQKDIDTVKGDIATIQNSLKNCVTAEQMNKAIDDVAKSLSTKNANLITLLTKQLRSLVFIPNLYVDGIEATEYDYLSYIAMKTGAMTATGNNHLGQPYTILPAEQQVKPWAWVAGTEQNYKNMPRTVSYELNPATAEVKAKDVKLLSRYVETITRAVADPQITFSETGFVANKEGNLVVGYTALGQNLSTDKNHAWIMAAQVENYNDEESNVGNITSDYAMVYGAPVTPLAVAYNQVPAAATAAYPSEYHAQNCALNTDELWKTAPLAAQNVPSVFVQWDGNVDLSKIIEIHYAEATGTSNATSHDRMTLQEAADLYGLSVAYYPVEYTVGTNVTSDTKFTTLNGSVVTPCGVTEAGAPTGVANKNSVGRDPLYQVQVLDGNKVVLVGFIKLEIVETKEPVVDVTTGEFNLGEVDFGCNGDDASVTWAQINNILLGHVGPNGISKEEFVQNYELVKSGNNAVQYSAPGTVASTVIGTITEVPNQTSTTTTVLNWNLTMQDEQMIYEMNNHTYTVYVCYERNNGLSAQFPKYYLPLTVKVVKPQDIDNSTNIATKSNNYWMRNETVAISNVKVPENGGIPTYIFDIDDEWWHSNNGVQVPGPVVNVSNAVTTRFGISSSTFANENGASNGYKYYFTALNNRTVNNVPVNGKSETVVFSVSADKNQGILSGSNHAVSAANQGNHALLATGAEFMNTTLYAKIGSAAAQAIAVLDQTTGVVTYQENATAKALLNAYASYNGVAPVLDRLSAELYANVGVCAYYGCDLVLPLTNGNWNVFFLRPVNIDPVSPKSFQDAHDNGSTLDLFDMLTFSDWRNQLFSANPWYYAYYQVTGVSVDTANILSNAANGTFAKNETINACFTFTPGNAITAGTCSANNSALQNQTAIVNTWKAAFGKITYKNDGTNTKDFKVILPVKISYYWGDIYVNVQADVFATLH